MPRRTPVASSTDSAASSEQFQQKGLGDAVDSWINTGANKDISPGQVSNALPSEMVDELAKRTGLSRDQVIGELCPDASQCGG